MFAQKLTKLLLTPLIPAALALAPLAHAASLDQAKTQGKVCELPTGYLQATGSAAGGVKAMVRDVNARRKAEYARIAEENGVRPDQVGKLTAQKLGPKCQ